MRGFTELAVFAAVSEAGSFTAAARRLRISKAAVSDHVARLEADLGTRLLNRTTRRLSLTEAGAATLAHSQAMVREAEAARAAASEHHAEPVGTLRVACPQGFAAAHIAPHCAGFLASYPRLALELSENPFHADLVGERFDMAVRMGSLPDSTLRVRRVGEARLLLVAAPAYAATIGPVADPPELDGADLLEFTPLAHAGFWDLEGLDGRFHRLRGTVRLSSDSGAVLLEAARSGLGVAQFPDWAVSDLIASGELVRVLPGWGRAGTTINIVTPGGRHPSAKVRLFSDWLEKAWRAQPPGAGAPD